MSEAKSDTLFTGLINYILGLKKTYKTKFPWQSKVNHLVYRLNIKNI